LKQQPGSAARAAGCHGRPPCATHGVQVGLLRGIDLLLLGICNRHKKPGQDVSNEVHCWADQPPSLP